MTLDKDALLFDVRRSSRYHDRRRAFFCRLHRLLVCVMICIAVVCDSPLATWAAGIAAFAALEMALRHEKLRERFCYLEMSVLDARTPAALDCCQLKRLKIELDEPPVYRALDLYCYAELCTAEGRERPANFPPLRWFHALTSQFYTWPNIASGVST
jgi:hypothetical protein